MSREKKIHRSGIIVVILPVLGLCLLSTPAKADVFPPEGNPAQRLETYPVSEQAVFIAASRLVRDFQKSSFSGKLLDVRPVALRRKNVLPGSLHVLPHHIKIYQHLRGIPLYLIDQGHNPGQMAVLCQQLRQQGFLVWGVFGGMLAWHKAGGAIQGDPRDLAKISPSALRAAGDRIQWIAVGLSPPVPPAWQDRIAWHTVPERLPAVLKRLEKVQKAEKEDPRAVWAVVTARGQGEEVQATLGASDQAPVFFLEGGAQAMKKWQAAQFLQHHAARQRRQRQAAGECLR